MAVSSALWFSLDGVRRLRLSDQQNPLFEFLLHRSITQHNLANQPQLISSSHGLFFPTAHVRIDGPLDAGFACPLRSAFRVWLPSWRLTPINPWPVFFHTDSAHGINPSKLSPLERPPTALTAGKTHLLFLLLIITPPKQWAGTAGRSFWVFTFRESLATTYVFSTATAGCSLGFHPSRAHSQKP